MDVSRLLAQLQASEFQDLAGSHLSARVPVSGALLNQIVADVLQTTSAPVRSVRLRPLAGERFEAVVTTTLPFVPALTVRIGIEQQARLPDTPYIVLRWSLFGGLGAFAARFVGALEQKLPPGIRLDGDRIFVDVAAMVRRFAPVGPIDPMRFLTLFEIHTADDRAIVDVEALVR